MLLGFQENPTEAVPISSIGYFNSRVITPVDTGHMAMRHGSLNSKADG